MIKIVLIVSDYRFNNKDVKDIISDDTNLFLDRIGRPFNKSKKR